MLQADEEALALLAHAGTTLAAANVPAPVLAALRLARLNALQKPSGGVRGIATGDAFRRLASRVLAHHYAAQIDQATRPYQYALQARAGTDALAALLRASLDADPRAAVVSIDGRAAYDTSSGLPSYRKLRTSFPGCCRTPRPSILKCRTTLGGMNLATATTSPT